MLQALLVLDGLLNTNMVHCLTQRPRIPLAPLPPFGKANCSSIPVRQRTILRSKSGVRLPLCRRMALSRDTFCCFSARGCTYTIIFFLHFIIPYNHLGPSWLSAAFDRWPCQEIHRVGRGGGGILPVEVIHTTFITICSATGLVLCFCGGSALAE